MTTHRHRRTGSRSWRRAACGGIGLGSAAAMLASVAVATAAPQHTTAASTGGDQAHVTGPGLRPAKPLPSQLKAQGYRGHAAKRVPSAG